VSADPSSLLPVLSRTRSLETHLRQSRAIANAGLACVVVARQFGLTPEEVLAGKKAIHKFPQSIAIYITNVELRSSQAKTGYAFSCSAAKVRAAGQKIEALRDGEAVHWPSGYEDFARFNFEASLQALIDQVCPFHGGAPRKYW